MPVHAMSMPPDMTADMRADEVPKDCHSCSMPTSLK